RFAGGGAVDFVLFEDGFEQFRGGERRVNEECGDEAAAAFGFFCEDLQGGVEKRGLAGADGARYDRKAFALKNALEENVESRAMRVGQVQEARVGREAKRFFFELVKGRVQTAPPWSQLRIVRCGYDGLHPQLAHFRRTYAQIQLATFLPHS